MCFYTRVRALRVLLRGVRRFRRSQNCCLPPVSRAIVPPLSSVVVVMVHDQSRPCCPVDRHEQLVLRQLARKGHGRFLLEKKRKVQTRHISALGLLHGFSL